MTTQITKEVVSGTDNRPRIPRAVTPVEYNEAAWRVPLCRPQYCPVVSVSVRCNDAGDIHEMMDFYFSESMFCIFYIVIFV